MLTSSPIGTRSMQNKLLHGTGFLFLDTSELLTWLLYITCLITQHKHKFI